MHYDNSKKMRLRVLETNLLATSAACAMTRRLVPTLNVFTSSQHSDGDFTDDDVKMQGLDLLEDAQMVDAAPLPALQSLTTIENPEQVWRKLPLACVADRWGYGRSPAFWYTLNFAYNHCYDLHRFHKAVVAAQEQT